MRQALIHDPIEAANGKQGSKQVTTHLTTSVFMYTCVYVCVYIYIWTHQTTDMCASILLLSYCELDSYTYHIYIYTYIYTIYIILRRLRPTRTTGFRSTRLMKEGPKTLFTFAFGELCRYLFYFGFICFVLALFALLWLYSLLNKFLKFLL